MTKNKIFREPINGFTHLFGAVVSLVGLIVLILKALISYPSSNLKVTSVIIFGVSLIFLYTASSVYHLVNSTDKVIKLLRRLDHSMIFILIAGTYTPICLVVLQGKLRWSIFIAVWSMALAGVLFKMIWFNMPRWLSTMFYILMGWFVVLFINPVSQSISMAGVVWLVLGGVFYTLGGIMYALKWPNLNLKFMGFHEIFHIFILLGSFSHYMCIFKYVI
ncbi:hemolysin III family protein [Clostridium sp. MB40-C1]|uniref:PAQR family membrane homeostasis protein TrhA n=1 Tax=Clostridium sp. MB40-C1 TaxID=3070996 RepID=UPI0027E14D99|nr:hemolysin III family protein [Clostridium sp. MB40-C1]WMJ80552.1 hemolysin III family protein [Clostridium sp. MB40-C1]